MRVLVTVNTGDGLRGIIHENGVYFETTGSGMLNVFRKDDNDRSKILATYERGYWVSAEYIDLAQKQEAIKVKRAPNGAIVQVH